jgi:hypothetical protein
MDIRLTAISFLNVLFPIREALGIGTANPKESLNQSLPTWRADTYCLGIWWFVTLTLLGRTIGISGVGQVAFVNNN